MMTPCTPEPHFAFSISPAPSTSSVLQTSVPFLPQYQAWNNSYCSTSAKAARPSTEGAFKHLPQGHVKEQQLWQNDCYDLDPTGDPGITACAPLQLEATAMDEERPQQHADSSSTTPSRWEACMLTRQLFREVCLGEALASASAADTLLRQQDGGKAASKDVVRAEAAALEVHKGAITISLPRPQAIPATTKDVWCNAGPQLVGSLVRAQPLGGLGHAPSSRSNVSSRKGQLDLPPPPKLLSSCPFELLSGVTELSDMLALGPLGGVWLGTYKGRRVAVKLSCRPPEATSVDNLQACSGGGNTGTSGGRRTDLVWLHAAYMARHLQHPYLLGVYDIRTAVVDEALLEALHQLAPRPASCSAAEGPAHHFMASGVLQVSSGPRSWEGPRSSAVHDFWQRLSPALPPGADRAFSSLRLHTWLGGTVTATIMEYSDMGTLRSVATSVRSARSPFRPSPFQTLPGAQRAVLRTARQIAEAMQALHAAGLCHGALTPSNVLLMKAADNAGSASRSCSDDDDFTARVADVGAASLMYSTANPAASSQCILFAAPEVLSNGAALNTTAADVYSYGMLLYVMAVGKMPFKGKPFVPVLLAVVSQDLRPEWPMGEHDHLEPLFRRCVSPKPELRPSFHEIANEISLLEQQIEFPANAALSGAGLVAPESLGGMNGLPKHARIDNNGQPM